MTTARPQSGMAMPRGLGAVSGTPSHRFVIFTLAFLAGCPSLKFANIEWLEMFMLAHLAYLLLLWAARGFQVRLTGLWLRPGVWFGLIMLAILLTDVSSARLPRYPPLWGPYFLHFPLLVVVMRYVELFIVVFYGLYAAELMRRDHKLRDFGLKVYVNSALLTAWLSLIVVAKFKLAGMSAARGQGLFPEGGPWGLYLLTVAVVATILWKRGMFSRPKTVFVMVTLGLAFYSCRSKASAACALAIFLTQVFFGYSWRQRLVSLVAIGGVLCAAWYVFNVPGLWRILLTVRADAEIAVYLDPENHSTAYGRVAGSVIVPRMIDAHPLTGIGMGNYPIMRNDPNYLGIMAPVKDYDLPGLGLLAVAAELGIPSLLALYVMMMYPAWRVRHAHGKTLLLTLALCQPYVHLMGAQITLFYPWLVSGFVLSFLPLPAAAAVRRGLAAVPAATKGLPMGATG
jgi:hypothetical protein